MANQFFQSSKSIANLHRVCRIFCSNDKAAALSKQSLLTEREKEQRNPREAANDKRAKSGRGSVKNRLSAPERLQVIRGGKQNS